ncbi:ABC transporter ATP-binding protein [Janibacter anophelis]
MRRLRDRVSGAGDSRLDSPLVTRAVVVEDLCRVFGETRAVDGASWAASSGEITCVLGPNGAGKTTTIECLEGLQRPDSGTCRVLGTDPWQAGADHRARVGVMLQDGGLPQSVSAARLLTHLQRLYRTERSRELIDRLDIAPFARTPVRRLSGGQRQRVALAAALLGDPEVAFLDEPTAGLDPHARLAVWELIRERRDAGVALVVTTHGFDEAERLADRVVILDRGRVVADGTPGAIAGEGRLEDAYFALTGGPRGR